MKRVLLFFLSVIIYAQTYSQTTYYSRQNGAWNNPNTWSTVSHVGAAAATVPGTAVDDIVLIGSGHVVECNPFVDAGNTATIQTLTLDDDGGGGTLRWAFSNYNTAGTTDDLRRAHTLIVTGNVTLNTAGNILSVEGGTGVPVMNGAAANRTHNFDIGGNLTMDPASTFDMQVGVTTNRVVNLEFNGSTNQTISGEATIDLWEIEYDNSGTSPNDRITNSSIAFTTAVEGDRSTFTTGTYVHNNSGTYTGEDDAGYIINTNIIVQDGVFNMIVNHGVDRTGTINGDLTVSAGQFNSGSTGALVSNLTLNGTLSVSGTGVVNIGDGDPGTTTNPTDATLTLNNAGCTVNAGTLYSHDLTLAAGVDLTISNGAAIEIGNGLSTGNIAMNGGTGNGATITINDATTTVNVHGSTDINEDSKLTVNDGIVAFMPNLVEAINSNPEAIILDVSGAEFEINGGTVDILETNDDADGNAKALIFDADNTTFRITSGTVNFGNGATAQGNVRFRLAAALTANFIQTGGTVNIYDDFERNNNGAICNVSISGGSTLNVGLGATPSTARSEVDGGTFTVADTGTDVNFGGPITVTDVTMTGLPTLDVGTNLTTVSRSILEGTFTKSVANTILFESGLDIDPGASLSVNSGTINIFTGPTTMDGSNDDSFYLEGDVVIEGGIINVGSGITTVTSGIAMRMRDGSSLDLRDGNLNVLTNAGLTSIAGGNLVNLENNGAGVSTVTIGDGSGSASTAIFQIAPNLAPQLPTPTARNLFDMDGVASSLTVNSDGLLQVGGGNIGNLRLNTAGASMTLNGGTTNITASLTLDNGTSAVVNDGTLNIGTSSSNGINRITFAANPTGVTSFTLNGGTVNLGDGNSLTTMGNGNTTPAFGTVGAYQEFNITGGTFNLNGGLNLDDANARFRISGGALIFDPQADQNLIGSTNMLFLQRGIVEMTGGTITFLNPNANSDTGRAWNVSPAGTTGNQISDYNGGALGGNPVDMTGTIVQFGDGAASSDGSSDGFDLNLSADHTYPTVEVNNPSGSNRQVEILAGGNNYQSSGDLTITAGNFDINDNTWERTLAGGTFALGASGTLTIGNANGANHFPGSGAGPGAAYTTYNLDINSTVTVDGAGAANIAIPAGPDEFGNLTIQGSGNKTLSAAHSVRNVLTLTGGTFVVSTNLTMDSGSKILRTNTDASGIMTGTVQGANDYTIEYTGVSKNTQAPEWSGSGPKSLIVNLNAAETLTLHTTLTAGGDLTITSGILADAGTTFTVNGNISNSDTHSGAGKILLTGGTAIHTISGDGTGIFQNLEFDDLGFEAQFQADQTVNGILTLTDGILNIDTYLLTLGNSATVSVASPSATRMIQVEGTTGASGVTKGYTGTGSFTWPFGVSGKYTPATINVTSTGVGGTINIKPIDQQNPFTSQNPPVNLELDYYWAVATTGFSSPIATHNYTYDQSDATGRGNESAYVPGRYLPSTWTTINDVSQVDEVLNIITFSNVTYLDGDFTAGEPTEFGVVLTYYSLVDGGDWNNAASWSTVGFGGAPATTIPGSNRPVLIGDNKEIRVSSNNIASGSIDIQTTGILEIGDGTTGHDFGTVTGDGVLEIISNSVTSPTFPGGTFTVFLSASGGTVEYIGTGDYTLPATPTEYNNLTIGGSSATTKVFPDADLTLNGNLLIDGTNTVAQISATTSGDLTITGNVTTTSGNSLQFMDGVARSVDVNGSVSNAGTLDVENAGATTHALSIAGDLTNTGTFDLFSSSIVNATFDGSSDATISGNGGTTDFYRLIVNKGSSTATLLDVTSDNFTLSGPTTGVSKALEIQNGNFRISAAHTVTLSTNGDFSVPSSGGITLNDASAVVEITTGTANLALAGLLQVNDGTVNIGDDATGVLQNDIAYTTGNAAITISSGTINVSGAVRGNPTTASLDYSQSGGNVNVARYKATTGNANDVADFLMWDNSGSSSFTMSGGTLKVIRDNTTTDGTAIRIRANVTNSVTGGTVQIAESGVTDSHDIAFTSVVPFYDFQVGNGTGFTGNIGGTTAGEQTLTVVNDLIINLNGEFRTHRYNSTNRDQDNFNLNVGGNFTVTNGTFSSGQDTGGGDADDVTFDGSGTQVISDAGGSAIDFVDLIINSLGTVQLGTNTDITVEEDWTLTAGTFDGATNSRKVTFDGTTTAGTINGSATTFYDLEINNTNGVTQNSSVCVVSNELTLTDGVLNILDNALQLTSTASTAIQGAPFSTSKMIRTDGTTSSQGVTKSFPAAITTFTYPVGTDVLVYTPATLNVTTAASAGTITMKPVSAAHPNAPTTDFLSYYWQVTSTIVGNPTITHTYIYDQSDVNGTEANYTYGEFNGTNWQAGVPADVDESTNTITVPNFVGQISNSVYTAGAGFSNPVVYYSCFDGDWDNTGTWRPAADCSGSVATEPQPGNPVIIRNHTVTVVSNNENASSVDISDASGILNLQNFSGHNFGVGISGVGTVQLESTVAATPPVLPTLVSSFVNTGGGTVEYTGATDYPLPAQVFYNDLIISGASQKDLDNSLIIAGDVTVSGGIFDLETFTADRSSAGGAFTLAAGTELEVAGLDNFPDNYATFSLDVTSTVEYLFNNAGNQVVSDLGGDAYGNITFTRTGGDPANKILEGNIDVNGNLDINRRAALLANDFDITVAGNWNIDRRNNTDFVPGTGTVTFDGGAAQTIQIDPNLSEVVTFNNIVVDNASGLSLGTRVSALNVNDLTITTGSIDLSNEPMNISGNFTNSVGVAGFLNPDLVTFNNTSGAQTISGAVSGTTFNDVTVAKASGLTLTVSQPITINGTLTMQNDGNVVLSGTTNDLTIGSSGDITGTFGVNRMIVTGGAPTSSRIVKNGDGTANSYDLTFPIGVGTDYTPVVVDASAVTTAGGSLGVRSIDGPNANLVSGEENRAIDRYYTMDLTSVTDITGSFSFTYADGDVQGTEVNYISRYWNGGSNWVKPDDSTPGDPYTDFVTPATNTFGGSAGTLISDANTEWVAGEPASMFPKLYSRVDEGDWDTPASWSESPTGAPASTVAPTEDNEVIIRTGFDIVVSANDRESAALDIETGSTLRLGTTTGHSIGPFTGSGILELESGSIPTYNPIGTDFFDAGNGTVEYTGSTSYTISSTQLEYNNLIITTPSSAQTKTLGGSITVRGDLTISDANTTLDADNTNNFNITLAGSFTSSGTLQPRQGTFTLNGAGAQTLPSETFFNVVFDNVGTKSITGAISTLNNFTILASSGTVNAGGNNISLQGDWSNSAGRPFFTSTATVTFNGSSQQLMSGATEFQDLVINNDAEISGDVYINTSITVNDPNVVTENASVASTLHLIRSGVTQNVLGTGSNNITFGSLVMDGPTQHDYYQNMTLNDNITITTGTLQFAAAPPAFDLSGNVTIDGTFDATNVTNGLSLEGNWTNNGTFTPAALSVTFDGSSGNQTLGGSSSTTFNALTISNTGFNIDLQSSITINSSLTLTDGLVNPAGSETVTLIDDATASSTANSFVQGKVIKEGDDDFVFPIGKNGFWARLGISSIAAPAVSNFEAEYFDAASPSSTTTDGSLLYASAVEYWDLTRTSGSATRFVELYWEDAVRSDLGTGSVLDDLVVAHFTAGQWTNEGNNGASGVPPASGSIRSDSELSTFSPFSLGSETGQNPLPVELISFTATSNDQVVDLHWSTASEINNDFFTVERSKDGRKFEKVVAVSSKGNSNSIAEYSATDERPYSGLSYYRLKQTDFDGTETYSNIVSVTRLYTNSKLEAASFPNPFDDSFVLDVSGTNEYETVYFVITDNFGKQLMRLQAESDDLGFASVEVNGLYHLANGVYIVNIITEKGSIQQKVIKY